MIGFVLAIGRIAAGCILADSHKGIQRGEWSVSELSDIWRWESLKTSRVAWTFGRCLALASCWMFKLVDGRKP